MGHDKPKWVADTDWMNFHGGSPGLCLGSSDGLVAVLLWLGECIKAARTQSGWSFREFLPSVPRVDHRQRKRLLTAFLLFGDFDARVGAYLTDLYLGKRGRCPLLSELAGPAGRRDLFNELLPREYLKYSPFAHYIDQAIHICTPSTDEEEAWNWGTDSEFRRFIPDILSTLRLLGYKVNADEEIVVRGDGYSRNVVLLDYIMEHFNDISEVKRTGVYYQRNQMFQTLTWGIFSSFGRAISMGTPVLSTHACGPAWISSDATERSIRILQLVWDEIEWLPSPSSFKEAHHMLEDERIRGLREDIELFNLRVVTGDWDEQEDVRERIRCKVRRFQGRPWATQVSRLITYAAVPISVAEMLLGSPMVGLSVASIGTSVQLISDLISKSKKQSWLSMGYDMLG